ncbi:MAG: transcription-repair coupling factor [Acidobacteria bacterium]|nr:MAG: transcription-repair coupling factor [Acidobacteriota bacterium]
MKAILEAIFADAALAASIGNDDALAIPEPARSACLAMLASREAEAAPMFVVAPNAGTAERLGAEMAALLPAGAVETLPAWETLPFEHVSPSTECVGERSRIIWRMRRRPEGLHAVILPIRALLQAIGPGCLIDKPLAIKAGAELDLDAVIELLGSWGYERAYQVEAHGEFAVRGGIFDVWPAGHPEPVRVELWGDEIDEIRSFSVGDQRATKKLGRGIRLFPCRELLLTEEVRAAAATQGGTNSAWEKIAEGIFFGGMESWLPWVAPDSPTIADLIPPASVLALIDPKAALDRASMLRSEEEALADALLGTWDLTGDGSDFPRLFADPEKVLEDRDLRVLRVLGAPEGPSTRRAEILPWTVSGPRLAAEASQLVADGWRVFVSAPDQTGSRRLRESIVSEGLVAADGGDLASLTRAQGAGIWVGRLAYESGFMAKKAKIALITLADLQGRAARSRRPGRATKRREAAEFFADISSGDYVVHYQHGIGRFAGMVTKSIGGIERDYLLVEYHGDDKLYVPTDQLDAIRKYSGGEKPRLSRLGGSDWARATTKARAEAAKVAERFVDLYRDRITLEGHAFSPDTPWQRELESSFPHVLTQDQAVALRQIKEDMESPQPMDRLICGDVGFGKTELAVRAAFKAVQDGMQVAILAPTTLLAHQHHQTFTERFEPFPVRVEMLSRFVSKADERRIIGELAGGAVDVVVGTHRLLQKDIEIPKLGLLVIDEEQRFGVSHKELIKEKRRNVDVLVLSATPIPRTLEMSLAGIRDMSTIATPPEERHPVITYVGEYDEGAVAAAIRREILRDGQVFYVHNRVRSIDHALAHVSELAPVARIAPAHGQMSEAQLEKTMMAFYHGEIDVLVTTTIVESGLDIESVNTLIVERADMLGLAQLYQLRGRVGRGRDRAYSYFFYPKRRELTEEAYERLKTIGEHTDLGSGFAIARKDLEIRGAGNLLGEAQSGHIAAVGFDLYCQLVSEAVEERKGTPLRATAPVRIELPVDAHIPEDYIEQESARLEAYRRLASAASAEAVGDVRSEWIDRFGPLPPEAESLFQVALAKAECAKHGIVEAVLTRGKMRLFPVELKASRQVRLERIARGATYKPEQRQLIAPMKGGPQAAEELSVLLHKLFD